MKRHQQTLENNLTVVTFKLFFPKKIFACFYFWTIDSANQQFNQNDPTSYHMCKLDPKHQQKFKPMPSPEKNYFVHFAMGYPVFESC